MDYQKLYERFEAEGKEHFNLQSIKIILDVIEAEELESKRDTLPFGKYKGKKLDAIAVFDIGYLKWLVDQPFYKKYPLIHDKISTLLK